VASPLTATVYPIRVAILALVVATAGCNLKPNAAGFADIRTRPREPVVQLRFGELPFVSAIAVHGWFAEYDPTRGTWLRWEISDEERWNDRAWGHVVLDVSPDWWTAGLDAWVHAEWRGDEARRIQTVLARPADYRHFDLYRGWPGPNSNSYPAIVLREAGVACDLPSRAVGKDYFWLLGGAGITASRTGVQLDTPLVGVALGLDEGLELHFLAGTLVGIDVWPPGLETLFGRLGFPE